jgi:hypothetical protein
MAKFIVEIQFKGVRQCAFSADVDALEKKSAESIALSKARGCGYKESVKKFVVRRAALNEYQVEVEVYKGTQTIRVYPNINANTEKEAKAKAKKYANSIGYYGTMSFRVFGGNPVQDHSSLVF